MGRITLLIDSPLRTLMFAMASLERDVKAQIGAQTKAAAQPIWTETTRENALNLMQSRLADSARVGVTAQNVFLRAGAVGRFSTGTPLSRLAWAIEVGANPAKPVRTTSRSGKPYTRRLGSAFGSPRRSGNTILPASRFAIRRIAALWVQTAVRTIHETIERV